MAIEEPDWEITKEGDCREYLKMGVAEGDTHVTITES